jgi:hypothetical protein
VYDFEYDFVYDFMSSLVLYFDFDFSEDILFPYMFTVSIRVKQRIGLS